MKKKILEGLSLEDLIGIYNSFWGKLDMTPTREDMIEHIEAYIIQFYRLEHMVTSKEQKDRYRKKALSIGKMVDSYRTLSLIQYNKLQIRIIKHSNLSTEEWIEGYGSFFNELVKDLKIRDPGLLEEILYGGVIDE